jgi:hypothetical protein
MPQSDIESLQAVAVNRLSSLDLDAAAQGVWIAPPMRTSRCRCIGVALAFHAFLPITAGYTVIEFDCLALR